MSGNGCTSRSRCRNARDCEYCAAVRQQQIGDIAEQIEQQHGQLTITVLKPQQNTAEAIKALHASFMRRCLAPAGIWTVEKGEQFGRLHLNILSPKPLPAKWRNVESYSELVNATARDAAAYIAKRAGMPDEQQYRGRLYGSWGQPGTILATQERFPVVQAAALELVLAGSAEIGQMDISGRWGAARPVRERSREEYAEIANRHLQTIRALTGRKCLN